MVACPAFCHCYVVPCGRYIGKLGDGGGNHDNGGNGSCGPPHRCRVSTIVDLEGIVGGVEPMNSDVDDPHAVEVG